MSVRPIGERRGLRALAATLGFTIVAAGAVVLGTTTAAQATTAKAFTLDFSQQLYGDFVEAGNSSVVCPTSATTNPTNGNGVTVADCTTAQNRQASANGTTYGNDSFNMQWANPATNVLNSSQAELQIPTGAAVAFARLNWSGDTGVLENANGNGQTAYAGCSASATAKLPAILPGAAYNSYSTEPVSLVANGTTSAYSPAANLQTDAVGSLTANSAQYYSSFADVTSQLQGLPSGSEVPLTVQNVWSPTGLNCYGGWSLTVVWSFPTANSTYAPIRRLVNIYNGHVRQQPNEADTTVSIPNLKLAGNVSRVGVTAYEGDYNITGDQLLINNTAVADPLTSGNTTPTTNNFFVGDADGNGKFAGNAFTAGPSNVFSVDAKAFATSLITPNATTTSTASFTFHTTGDSYLAQELAFSAPVPDLVITKSTTTTVAEAGGTASYTISVQNPTPSAINNVAVSDPSGAGCKNTIGTLAGNATVTYTCTVTVPNDASTSFTNVANVSGTDYTGTAVTGTASANTVTVIHPAITLSKTADRSLYTSGQTVTYTITAKNTGDATLTGTAVTDTNASGCAKTIGTLAAGASSSYTCTTTAPVAGGSNVAAVSATDTAGGTVSATATAPTPTAGSVTGNVFADLNNDGVQGSGETGIPGVTLTLTPASGAATTTTTTSNGGFSLSGVAPGTYTLTETQPTGYAQGKDAAGSNAVVVSGKADTFTVTVPDAGTSAGTTFGEIPSDSLAGTVFVDSNDDGTRQSSESGIAGVTVNLAGSDDAGNSVSLSTQTVSGGTYTFPALRPGTYTLTEVQPQGYVQGKDGAGTPAGAATTQDVISGIRLTGTNTAGTGYTFGELVSSSLSGTVKTDNGTALSGVTVTVTGTDDNGAAVSTTVTSAADGTYVVTGLRPGSYTVTETQPTAYGNGSVVAGSAGGTVNGANQVRTITLASNTSGTGYAFLDTTGTVAGTVFSDANNDGAKATSGEPGLGGVTVSLQGAGAGGSTGSSARTLNLTTTTASDGTFSFSDLPAGTAYTLTETTPPSYLNGKDTAGAGGGTFSAPDTFGGVTVNAGTAETGYLFGEVAPASLAGTVTDQNGNPEVGVKVDLGGAATATATTGSDGSYSVQNLYPGTYTLTEEQPAGLGNGTDTVGTVNGTTTGTASTVNSITGIALPAGGVGGRYVFTDVAGSLTGHAYVDANGNGAYDSGETGIANATITLTQGGTTVATTMSASNGSYTFSGLAAGTYTLTETQPTGYFEGSASAGTPAGTVSSPDVVSSVALGAGQAGAGYDFGDLLAASLAGSVKDDQGTAIAGVTLTLSGTTTQGTAITPVTTTTGSTGAFSFPAVAPGTYTVTETQPSAYGDTATTPATPGTAGGAVSSSNAISGIKLGSSAAATGYAFVDSTASLSGSVFIDANNDGIRQSGETGISSVTVKLTGGPNNISLTATTASDGSFSFPGLLAGTYRLTETQPSGYAQGIDQAGTTTSGTIAQNSTTDTVSNISVAAGAAVPGYTFGEYAPTGLAGLVTDDQGDKLAGVTVSVKSSTGTLVASTTTASDGTWALTGLAPGTYEIDETQPAGYGNGYAIAGTVGGRTDGAVSSSTPNAITAVTVTSGQMGAGFQFVDTSATIAGTVFVDANGNNALDGGESGLTGVTVTATGTVGGEAVTRTATSTSSGAFTVAGLPAGTYTLTETQPSGYSSGTDTAGSPTDGTASADGVTVTGVAVTAAGAVSGFLYPEYVAGELAGAVHDSAGNALVGVTVTATSGSGATYPAVTSSTGVYLIKGLPPGTYSLTETQPADYGTGTDAVGSLGGTVTSGNTISSIPVASGSAGTRYTYVDVSGTLSGTVFLDANDDGVQQPGESGISGVTLTVTGTTKTAGTSISQTATTASNGTFTVTGLPAGSYTLTETQPSGYVSGTDTAGTPTGTLSATDTFTGIQLGVAQTGTGYLFGEYTTASLSGTVKDPAGSGLPGATITIADGHGHSYTPAVGSNGTWSATGIVPGTYTVTETDPTGYGDSSATPGTDGGTATTLHTITGVAIASGSAGSGYAFVDQLGSLSGSVFADANGNGTRDSGESGVQGVTVTLSNSGGAVATTTTDANGSYGFTNLTGGTYTITETQPAGYAEGRDGAGSPAGTVSTQDVIGGIALPNGGAGTGYTFGEEALASLAGTVTVGGVAEPAVTVTLTGTTDQGVAVSRATTTSSSGAFSFASLAPGTYAVSETQPASYGNGAATAGSAGGTGGTGSNANTISAIPLGQGTTATGYAFTDSPASISGTVFNDANGNNTIDSGERGISGVTLTATSGSSSYTATTGSSGAFSFANLPAGTYAVTETQPGGYSSGTDSSPNGGTVGGDTVSGISLAAGTPFTGILYPETTTASLSGSVEDSAGNPLAGVTVTAYLGSATTGTTATTGSDGTFAFDTLTPGTYSLVETQPTGYGNGTASTGPAGGTASSDGNTISAIPVSSSMNDGGYAFIDAASTVTGAIFVDANGDNVRQSGEAGLSGVTVTATGTAGAGNGTTFTATTGSDGTFTVSGLLGGTYTLTEAQPSGYVSGTDTAGSPTNGAASADGVTVTAITVPAGGTTGGFLYPEYVTSSLVGTVQNPAGNGIAGAVVTVTSAATGATQTFTTTASGSWAFSGLAPGSYAVTEQDPTGYGSVSATAGSDGGTVPDPNTVTGVAVTSGSAGTGYGFVDALGTISGSVYVDANRNGVFDSGEPAVGGVTLTLSGGSLSAPLTTMTSSAGAYSFPRLAAGTYTLTETQPAGYAEGPDSTGTAGGVTTTQDVISGIALSGGQVGSGYLFGEETYASLTGTTNLDGKPESGVSVTLAGTTDGGAPFSQTVTSSGGQFSFTAVPPGSSYTLTETQPAAYGDGTATAGTVGGATHGTVHGADEIDAIALGQGGSAIGYAFTDVGATISGQVFDDLDGDNAFDNSDHGVPGTTVTATAAGGTTYTAVTTSGSGGGFTITGLPAGTYTLSETQPAGYRSGADTAGTFGGTLSSADTFTGLQVTRGTAGTGYLFPEYVTAAIAGSVVDSNGAGISGVTITVSGPNGSATTTTVGDGSWSISSLVPGTYTVSETQPAAYGAGSAKAGSFAGTVADPNDITGVKVVGGGTGSGYLFTDTLGSISGSVYVDANGNGVRDSGESGIQNVTVTLTGGGLTSPVTVSTGSSGAYSFGSLLAGTYRVTETQPAGYAQGRDAAGTSGGTTTTQDAVSGIALTGGIADTGTTFGEETVGSVAGTLTLGTVSGPGELGVTMTISGTTDRGTSFSATTTTTGSTGSYTFASVPPGTYTVNETQPAQYGNGTAVVGNSHGAVSSDGNSISGIQLGQGLAATGYAFTDVGAQIAGRVFDDHDGDNAFGSGDTGLTGVVITATGTNGTYTATSTTGGVFTLINLPVDTYTISEAEPSGYTSGTDNAGTTGGTVSADTITGVTPTGGGSYAGVLFPEHTTSSVAGTVIDDQGRAISGVTVTVTGGGTSHTTTTASDGTFSVANLPPGTYVVAETQPTGYGAGTAAATGGDGTVNGANEIDGVVVTDGGQTFGGYRFTDATATVAGVVFDDADGDGAQGSGEGISGVTVVLKSGGTTVSTATTGSSGTYTLVGIVAGTYSMVETQPGGYASGTDTAGSDGGTAATDGVTVTGVVVPAGGTGTGYRYAEYKVAGISGTVRDSAGSPVAGVTISIEQPNGTVLTTTTTDANGAWTVSGLTPGTYQIAETQPTGYGPGSAVVGTGDGGTASGPNLITGVTVRSGSSGTGYGFIDQLGSLTGTVYLDANGDGTQDNGETGIAGTSVTLTLPGGGTRATTTGSNGVFTFPNLLAGAYSLTETQPAGYAEGADATGTDGGSITTQDLIANIALGAGDLATGYAFGEESQTSLAGTLLLGGAAEPGVTITLAGSDDHGNAVSLSTTVGSGGGYAFAGVAPGTYTVHEVQPAQWGEGTATAGTSGGTVSDADTVSAITLAQGVHATGYAFTDTAGSVSGQVFVDNDGSNTFTTGDTGLSGVGITVTSSSGASFTGTTASGGSFTVGGLPAGTYTVRETTEPTGYTSGSDGAGTTGGTVAGDSITQVSLAAGDTPTGVTFPEYQPSSIGGTVADQYGHGIGGVTLTITDGSGAVVATVTTTPDGTWTASGLPPGTCTLTETQPVGYAEGSAVLGTGEGGATNGPDAITGIAVASGSTGTGYGFTDPAGAIRGTIYVDTDGDGSQDHGEPGLADQLVSLSGGGLASAITARTTSTGSFTFTGLVAGTYTLTETQPTGYLSGTDTPGSPSDGTAATDGVTISSITVTAGTAGSGFTYAEYKAPTVSGTVMTDVGTPIAGVLITAKEAGNVTTTVTTATDGSYTLTLPPGTYNIVETQPARYGNGSATVGTGDGGVITDADGNLISGLTVTSGSDGRRYAFTDTTSSVAGTVFVDGNGDGTQDGGEPGLKGVVVSVIDESTGATVATTTTGTGGGYLIDGLPAGTYTVSEQTPTGYGASTATAGDPAGTPQGDTVTGIPLGAGQPGTGYDFGNTLSSLAGLVFLDGNDDGVQQLPEDTGVAGVTVTATDTGTGASYTATTRVDGSWTIGDLPSGTFRLVETQPDGYANGIDTAGSDGGVLSAPDTFTGVTVAGGTAGTGYTFGEQRGVVTGQVYLDTDGNATRDPGEPPVAGVTIQIRDGGGAVVATTTTAADGSYTFGALPAGSYTVVEVQPAGYGSTTPDSVPVTISTSSGADVSFGDQGGSVSGVIWQDVNGDGVHDPSEPGVGGVTVTLRDAAGAAVATTTTTDDGSYTFLNLPAGTYTVALRPPTGQVPTTPGSGSDFDPATDSTAPITVAVSSSGAITQQGGEDGGLVVAAPDLAVAVHGPTGPVMVGTPVTTVIDVSDDGTTVQPGASLTIQVPPDQSVTSVLGMHYTCAIGTKTSSGTTVTCALGLTLQPGESAPSLTVMTMSLTAGTASIMVRVRPVAWGADDIASNNTGSDPVSIMTAATVVVPPGPSLPFTGLNAASLVLTGLLSMLGGLGLLLLGRRRRS